MSNPKGFVYIFTGDGKGKTSAALGVAMRAVGHGKTVSMIQWYKERRWPIGEHAFPKILKKSLFEIYPMGQGFYKLPTDHASPEEHRRAAREALQLGKELLSSSQRTTHNPPPFLLILDEVINTVNDHLIELDELINVLSQRGSTHVVLTGRNAPKELVDLADLVTEMRNVKHPYEKGQKAVLGLDF